MSIRKITEAETVERSIASLPVRPNSSSVSGQAGLTSVQLREAFDALPRLVRDRYNELVDAIIAAASSDKSILRVIKSGIESEHTLYDLMEDIKSGALASYAQVQGVSLAEKLVSIDESIGNGVSNVEYEPITGSFKVTRGDGSEESVRILDTTIDELEEMSRNAVIDAVNDELNDVEYINCGGGTEKVTRTLENRKHQMLVNFTKLKINLPNPVPVGFKSTVSFKCYTAGTIDTPIMANYHRYNDGVNISLAARGIPHRTDHVDGDGLFKPKAPYKYRVTYENDGDMLVGYVEYVKFNPDIS